ncbi:MAG: acyl-CoA dehydrogenase family protein [Promethearchaeati archaeon SRVP18_Atabeyarchaeia-1]
MSNIFLNDEEAMYQVETRDFLKRELTGVAEEIEKTDRYPREVFRILRPTGNLGGLIPKEYGGSDQGAVIASLFAEEMGALSPAIGMCVGASSVLFTWPIVRFGTKQQKTEVLPQLARGEKIGCICITEPNVGSDVAGMKTTAKKEGDYYLLNGEKRFITNGGEADYLLVFAVTDPKVHAHQGMTAFLVEKTMPGFKHVKDYELMGNRGAKAAHLTFQNVKVPKENIIGKENSGFLVVMDELDIERTMIAGQAIGCARTPFEAAVKYSTERVQFDQTISRFEGVSFKVADMGMAIDAARLLMLRAARMIDKGLGATKEASMAKLFAVETAVNVTYSALQMLGGIGYTKEYDVEQFARDARLMPIGGGTSEILRYLIQREIYKESKEKQKKP